MRQQEAPGKCVRVEAAPGALLSSGVRRVIARLVNTGNSVPAGQEVFNYAGNANTFSPSYVKVHIEVPAKASSGADTSTASVRRRLLRPERERRMIVRSLHRNRLPGALSDEAGFTLVELMVAVMLLTVGLLSCSGTLDGSRA